VVLDQKLVDLHFDPSVWIAAYGYWAVFVLVALESMGVPLPGETVLVAAAIYAGTSHELNILASLPRLPPVL
jgi:membrane protein DedA with SNARE-associated domain